MIPQSAVSTSSETLHQQPGPALKSSIRDVCEWRCTAPGPGPDPGLCVYRIPVQCHSNPSCRTYPSLPNASQLYLLCPLKNQDIALTVYPETCSVKTSSAPPPIVPCDTDNSAHSHSSVACVDHEHMYRAHWPELQVPPAAQVLLTLPTALLALAVSIGLS